MFRSLFPFRRLLATTFLVVFVNVFAGQCWCATLNRAATSQATVEPALAPSKPTHPGCQGHGGATAPAKKPGHQHKSSEKDNCCRDKSASLLSSLSTPVQKHLFSPAPAVLPALVEFHFRPLAGQWDRTTAVVLVPPRQLKPKIPDIRIFIRSLTV